MSEIEAERNDGTEASPTRSRAVHFLWQQLPYNVALVLAIAGVAYTNALHQPLTRYWEFLALAIGVVCVINKWPEIESKQDRWRLIWTQALHWIAVLITMTSCWYLAFSNCFRPRQPALSSSYCSRLARSSPA